jgi:Zn-dependent protease with chaperone function
MYFSLLVAAVLATGSIVYHSLYFMVPSQRLFAVDMMTGCWAARYPGSQQSGVRTTDDITARANAAIQFGDCLVPLYRDQLAWIAVGLVVLFGLAALLYVVHPQWIICRGRLAPLKAEDSPELAAYLAGLVDEAGLSRPPVFVLAPTVRTVSGVTFGRFRRYFVRLDAGLVVLFTTDRSQFRAVVLHELAHLANRDVNKTYLTIAIWRSFVAVAMLPLVLAFVFVDDVSGWSERLRVAAALAVLTGLVYLTRNAVLREREVYADARSATYDGSDGALRDAVSRLRAVKGPRWWAVMGSHPLPEQRMRAIDDPGTLLRIRLWELFAAGMVTAAIAANLSFLMTVVIPTQPMIRGAVPGLVCVPGLGAPLGIAVWRAGSRALPRRPPIRAVVLPAVVLTAGFLLGAPVAFVSFQVEGLSGLVPSDGLTVVIAGFALLAGSLALAAWTASATRTVFALAPDRRWAPGAVVAAGALAVAPWLAVWFLFYQHLQLPWWLPGSVPTPDAGIGWYATLARWAGSLVVPLMFLYPLTLPGLVLLWLVPVLVVARRGRSAPATGEPAIRVRPALVAGLAGSALFALVGAALVYAAKAGLPAAVRASDDFPLTLFNVMIAVAVLAQAGAAAALAAHARRHRAVLVPLAVFVGGVLATAALMFGVIPLARCIDLQENSGGRCFGTVEAAFAAQAAHEVIVKGMLAALPAAMIGAVIGALVQRARPDGAPAAGALRESAGALPDGEPAAGGSAVAMARGRFTRGVSVGATVAVLVAVLAASVLMAPKTHSLWVATKESVPADASTPEPLPTQSPTPVPHGGPCLFGVWREVSHQTTVTLQDGRVIRFTEKDIVQTFRADGTGMLDYGVGNTVTWTSDDTRREIISSGTITWTYQVRGEQIFYSDVSAQGTITTKINGKVLNTEPMTANLQPDRYSCTDDTMTQTGDFARDEGRVEYTIVLHRTN